MLARSESVSLIRGFIVLARKVLASGGHVSFKWPKSAPGWNDPEVLAQLYQIDWHIAEVHGCSVGMKGKNDIEMYKPWWFWCSSAVHAEYLNKLRCLKHHAHTPCEGQFTKGSGSYSTTLARKYAKGIVLALAAETEWLEASVCQSNTDLSLSAFPCFNNSEENTTLHQGHRPKSLMPL